MPSPTFQIVEDPTRRAIGCTFGTPVDRIVYTVTCTNGTADPTAFFNAIRGQYPSNSSHPIYTNMSVVAHVPLTVESPNTCYKFAVDYAQPESGTVPADVTSETQLLTLPPRVESLQQDFYQEPCEFDQYGNAITNSAGDPFDPPGYVERSRHVVVLSKWVLGFDSDTYGDYLGKLNTLPVVIPGLGYCDTRHVRCLSIRPSGGYNPYIAVTVTGVSGTAQSGDLLNWGSDGSGYFNSLSNGTLVIINPTADLNANQTITDVAGGTASTLTCTVSVGDQVVPIKIFMVFECRETGFDFPQIDRGQQGWALNGTNNTKTPINLTSSVSAIEGTVPLIQGVPSAFAVNHNDTTYSPGPNGYVWNPSTTQTDQLLSVLNASEMSRSTVGLISTLTFERLSDIDFNTLPPLTV
jgi:hypothetical protein